MGGSIVNVTDAPGIQPSPGASAYLAIKAGLISLAAEWAPTAGIDCACAWLLETDAGDEYYGDRSAWPGCRSGGQTLARCEPPCRYRCAVPWPRFRRHSDHVRRLKRERLSPRPWLWPMSHDPPASTGHSPPC
jgi:NAD(P)-dependent dehydrogenase (short-subunit alcohol dehydrogenase family)